MVTNVADLYKGICTKNIIYFFNFIDRFFCCCRWLPKQPNPFSLASNADYHPIIFFFHVSYPQIQFFLIMMHWLALLIHPTCGFPKWPVAVMIPQNLFMMALFGDFYYKSYVQKTKKCEAAAATTSAENHTNNKIHTNSDSRHRHTNGRNHTNGNAKNDFFTDNSNGNAANGKSNGTIVRKLNDMS